MGKRYITRLRTRSQQVHLQCYFFLSYKTAPQKRKDSWNLYIISPTAFWGSVILKCHFVTFSSAIVLLLCRVSFQFIVLYIMYILYYISLWCILPGSLIQQNTVHYSPNLTWRDMQHLTVLTSKRNSLFDPYRKHHWKYNGAGLEFNHLFGYGVLDAGAMVDLAQKWKPLPERFHCTAGSVKKEE